MFRNPWVGVCFLALAALGSPGESAAEVRLAHLGVKFGGPLGLAGSGGVGLFSPVVLEGEAGTGGAKVSLGLVSVFTSDSMPGNEPRLGLVHTMTFRGVAVRTWGSPFGVAPNRTLVGGEVEYSLFYLFTLQGGVLYPVDGRPGRDYVLSWGVGVHLYPLLKW